MKRVTKVLALLLVIVLLTGCGRAAESAEQSSDLDTYSFSIDRESVDSIRLIQDRETQKVWTTDDPEQIDTICDLFSSLSYGPRRYDAGYAGTYLRIEFMAGDTLIKHIALANPEEVQVLDEEPGFCVSILSGAWTETEWDSFLGMIASSAASDKADVSSDLRAPDQVTLEDIDVTVRLSYVVISPDSQSIGIYFENHSDADLSFGWMYQIEKLEAGQWRLLDFTFDAWTYNAIPLPAGETVAWAYKFSDLREPLTEGRYRITHSALLQKTESPPPIEYEIPALEFEVREGAEKVGLPEPWQEG